MNRNGQERENAQSIKASIRDGMASSAMLGVGENYLGPFGIFLQASPLQVGILATLPPLIGAFFQWVGVWLIERVKNRRRILTWTSTLQALVWIPIALLAYWPGRPQNLLLLLIGTACLYQLLNGILAPVWNSLIGDLISTQSRGAFFGRRNRMCSIFNFAFLLLGGQILHYFEAENRMRLGFACIFFIALGARLLSAYWLQQHGNPPTDLRAEHRFSFYQFVSRIRRSNFTKFVFFCALINFAVATAGPYFSLYMLRELQFSYAQFTFISAATTLAQFMTMQHWGKLTDRFGTKRILEFCAPGVVLAPILWLFSANFWYLLLIQAYVGFVWAGYNLAAANFMFDAVSPPKRARCVAYQGVVNGLFTFAGSLVGGLLATHAELLALPHRFLFGAAPVALTIFLLSGLLRLVVVAFLVKQFHEVREVEAISRRGLFFQIMQVRPLAGVTFGITWGGPKKGR